MLYNCCDNEAYKLKSLLFQQLYQDLFDNTYLVPFKVLINAFMYKNGVSLNTIKVKPNKMLFY